MHTPPRPPVRHLLYLHGFRSSPQSAKALQVAERVRSQHPGVVWCCPQLPPSPREAADLMRLKTVARFDAGLPCGPEANMTKYLCSEAAWEAAEAAMTTLGGYGVTKEYHLERKWRECRLYRTAPISNNLVLAQLAEHVLGMPRSY